MTQKLYADSNRASLREVVETNWGETPTGKKSRARRFTTSSITVTKETTNSEEIRDDRMTGAPIETSAQSGGEINWEFSAGNVDGDMQRVLGGYFSRPIEFDVFRGEHVSIVWPGKIVIAGMNVVNYFTAGRRLRTSGFVRAENNRYCEIIGVQFVGGNTEISVNTGIFGGYESEAGSAYGTVADANDVVILRNDTLRFGTGGGRTIDSNGGNAFAAAIAAKQLIPGQRIFVEGIGYETATVTVNAKDAGDTITFFDGDNELICEVVADANDPVAVGHVKIVAGVDTRAVASALTNAINRHRVETEGAFALAAVYGDSVMTVTNLNKVGGSITETGANFTVANFTGGNASVGGYYKIVSATSDILTVDRPVPTIASGKPITIKASMLRNPYKAAEIALQSMTIETGFQDVSQFFVADGLRAGAMSLSVSTGALITGSTTTMGRETKRVNATKLAKPADYTVLDAPATENVSATANVGALLINGEEVSTALQSIELTIEGNLRAQQAIGNKYPIGIQVGRLNITGTITAYFADGTMFDRFLSHATVGLAFPISDIDGNTYWISIPAFKLTSDPISPGGTDQDVMETMEFTAFRDSATKCMIQIDRFSSNKPVTSF